MSPEGKTGPLSDPSSPSYFHLSRKDQRPIQGVKLNITFDEDAVTLRLLSHDVATNNATTLPRPDSWILISLRPLNSNIIIILVRKMRHDKYQAFFFLYTRLALFRHLDSYMVGKCIEADSPNGSASSIGS